MSRAAIVEITFNTPEKIGINPEDVPVEGSLRVGDGASQQFSGWVDLISCLEPIAAALLPADRLDK